VLSGPKKAATAEALMRSRYSAYVMGDIAYLLLTWHSSTRPPAIDPDTIPDWCGLDIIRTDKGQVDDDEGIVEFKATALSHGRILTLHEVSRFVQEAGQWLYVSGDVIGDSSQEGRITEKVGRNCLCPCGSGKKFKKCCGP
jgi:SEC-C motif-containing protein